MNDMSKSGRVCLRWERIMFLCCMASSLFLMVHASSRVEEDENPEQLFRRAVAQWRSQRNVWTPWIEFTQEILHRFESNEATGVEKKRLQLVGALEEGILALERATMNEGENAKRDAAISKLYAAYGKTLMELNPKECLDLAMDPHTLLIGAETASRRQGDDSLFTNDLCVENAENALRNAVTLDATNSLAEQLLETITGTNSDNAVHKRKPKEFVAELFDSFADTFDEKLLDGLGYKVPKLVGDVAKQLLQQQQQQDSSGAQYYSAVLDAGCGTGLAGRFLRPLIATPSNTNSNDGGGVMIGVDASQKMLDIAAKCTTHSGCGLEQNVDGIDANTSDETNRILYDNLLVLDLEEMTLENTLGSIDAFHNTKEEQQGFDLIVAADVLVYFGNLEHLLATFAKVSRSGASLVFSCERATQDEAPLGWRLLSSGRFAHTKQHAVETASQFGYELASYQEIVPRMEKGEEVRGHLFGFRLTTMLHPTTKGQQNGEL